MVLIKLQFHNTETLVVISAQLVLQELARSFLTTIIKK